MDRLTPARRSWLMGRVKSKNTAVELVVRRLIFGMGFRYRLHDKNLDGRPDIVFAGRRKVIFVNGCFWHGHVGCNKGRLPKSNVAEWSAKIQKNKLRDRNSIKALRSKGWNTLSVWQCEIKNLELLAKRLYEFIEIQ
jgi:DNA mismatch endonuclease (patch repair protein)